MKQRKWLRRAAKALVLAMVLSLTMCVTAHANVVDDLLSEFYGGRDGFDTNVEAGLIIWGFEGNATVSWDNGAKSKPYSPNVNVPGLKEVTVTFDGDLQSVEHIGDWTKDGTFPTKVDLEHDSFTYVCFPCSGSQSNFKVKVVDRNSADSGNTDSGNTDSGNTDSGNTDPGNTDPGNTDPGNTDPGKADPSNPSNPADPADPGKPADPSKPTTGDTMLITLWAVVLMGTAIGITALVRKKKNA